MDCNLTIDVGNSCIKAVLFQVDGSAEVAATVLRGPSVASRLAAFAAPYSLRAAMACSVAKSVTPLLDAVNAPLKLELTASTPVPLVNEYATPATLGVDRLAAAVGAMACCPGKDLLVCDLGTACTFDEVTASGAYRGGNIAPGVGMRLRALHHYTERLPLVNAHSAADLPDFGRDTASALCAGALRGVVAELLYYRSLGTQSPRRVILTGGWAPELAALLPSGLRPGVTLQPHLVNQGLNSILLHNLKEAK
ncbi:MAG: type III pantothenate kinase [Muribaculaceae bacterium]|nr:type III pantothenate kinase [Muribaculaceae bacterium]MDE6315213.1 type III pantothenate kinase [Muribaculaceae bacterium]